MRVLLLAAACAAIGQAQQPFLFYGGAYHAATYAPAGLLNSSLPRGGIITLFGRNLGPAVGVRAETFPLSTTLAGASIDVVRGTQVLKAIPIFVSATQVNAILPSNTPIGAVSIRLLRNNLTSNPLPVDVANANFGFFSINSAGFGPGIVTNFVDAANQPLNSSEESAKPGQVVTLWGTGLGPVTFPDNVAPTAGDLTTKVEVRVGNIVAEKLYSGRAPCCSGLDQIVIRIPTNAPTGCFVPLQVLADQLPSNTATIAIATDGGECTEAISPFSRIARKGGRLARIILQRSSLLLDPSMKDPFDYKADFVSARFADYQPNPFAYQFFDALPPVGSCSTSTQKGTFDALVKPFLIGIGKPFSAGANLSFQGLTTTSLPAASAYDASYAAYVGSNTGDNANPALFFPTGQNVNVSVPGASGVPAFSFAARPDLDFNWTNRSTLTTVRTAQPLTLNWTASTGSEIVVIAGANYNQANNASAAFVCSASSAAGTFTVPSYVLASIPREPTNPTIAFGLLMAGRLRRAPTIPVDNLNAEAFTINWQGRTVFFR